MSRNDKSFEKGYSGKSIECPESSIESIAEIKEKVYQKKDSTKELSQVIQKSKKKKIEKLKEMFSKKSGSQFLKPKTGKELTRQNFQWVNEIFKYRKIDDEFLAQRFSKKQKSFDKLQRKQLTS